MAVEKVELRRPLPAPPEHIWSILRSFDVGWHADVAWCRVGRAKSGALVREFDDRDGTRFREVCTYLSDSDRRLNYRMTAGPAHISSYAAQVCILQSAQGGSEVRWAAEMSADQEDIHGISKRTEAIFTSALNTLASVAPPNPKSTPTLRPAGVQVREFAQPGWMKRTGLMAEAGNDGPQALVIFLHGIGGNASNWAAQVAETGQFGRSVAINLRGYGGSALNNGQTDIEDHCNDILSLADHLGARRLVLVGLSMGAWIATSFAMRHGDRLAGLVLAGGCTGMSEAPESVRKAFLTSRGAPLDAGQAPVDFAPEVVEMISSDGAHPDVRTALTASMSAIPAETYRDALRCFCNPPERFDFRHITCPVLMITGDQDRLAPPEEIRSVSRRIHDAGGAPFVRFEVLKDAGHVCNLEQPQAFNAVLTEFLSTLPDLAPAPTNKQKKRAEKRQRILSAALEEFSRNGFGSTTMEAIAARATVSKPTLYSLVGDKEAIFAQVLDQGRATIVAPLAKGDGALVDVLWDFAWTYARFVLRPDMLSLARLVLGEAGRRPETAQAYHQSGPGQALRGIVAFIVDRQASGELIVDDAELAAQDLWSLILSGPRDHFLHHVADRPDDAALSRQIVHGLRVFLKAYAHDPQTAMAELDAKTRA